MLRSNTVRLGPALMCGETYLRSAWVSPEKQIDFNRPSSLRLLETVVLFSAHRDTQRVYGVN